jgi:lipoprotein-releasing system permease protein
MSFEWFVARRYLAGGRGARKDRFLSAVTVIAVAAVAAGVMALVLALAINAGFREAFEERLLGATAHVTVTRADASGIRDYNQLAARLNQIRGVETVTPALYETVLISSGSRASGIVLKGIPPEDAAAQAKLFTRWREGGLKLEETPNGLPPLLIGHELANNSASSSATPCSSPAPGPPHPSVSSRYRSFEIAGVFESGFWDFDAGWVFTRLDVTRNSSASRNGLSPRAPLSDVYDAEEISREADAVAGKGFATATWMELNEVCSAPCAWKTVTALIIASSFSSPG